jgi:outer membrane biosynthesis protein TonB
MRPLARLGFVMVLAAAAALVSGCDTLENMGSLLDSKTKLSGERKPVFPEGVPGVTPGVPPEMVKGYREPVVETPPAVPGEQPQAAEAKPKPKPKPHAVQTAAKPQPAPVAQAAAPAPAPASAAAPWPSQQQQQPQQQPQAAWPSAPSSGTISR